MARAVDTITTKSAVEKNGVRAYLADFTDGKEEIKSAIEALGGNSIPLLAIYPAGKPDEPIILRDVVSQEDVLQALQQAGPSKTVAAVAPSPAPNGSRTAMQ